MRSNKKIIAIMLCGTILGGSPAMAQEISVDYHGGTNAFLNALSDLNLNGGSKTFVMTENTHTYSSDTAVQPNPKDGQILKQGNLTIYGQPVSYEGNNKMFGSLGVVTPTGSATDSTKSLNVQNVGDNFDMSGYDYTADTGTAKVVDYWTSGLEEGFDPTTSTATRQAVYIEDGNLTVNRSAFAYSHNTSVDDDGTGKGNDLSHGGAIRIGDNGTGTITDSLFYDNSTQVHGGAVDVDSTTSSATITGSSFVRNRAAEGGGALDVDGTATLSGNVFTGNTTSGNGGAILVDGGSINSSTNDEFYKNTAAGMGGAVYNTGTAVLTNDTFSGNTAGTNGGAIANSGNLTSTGSVLTGNSSTGAGGAIANTGTMALTNATITNNAAGTNGGGIYNAGVATVKGNTTIAGNTAALGSNLYNDTDATFIVSDVHDEIDLDYQPLNDQAASGLPSPQHTLFDQAGDIVNKGTLTFQDSEVQLHNGINTKLDTASRNVGSVNINNSRIDLGGVNVAGDGVIYADKVNIGEGSTVQTHVGLDSDKFGHIEANEVTVAPNNTKLDIVVAAGELAKGESKDYAILDAPTVTGGFDELSDHNLYTIVAQKDAAGNDTGVYTISRNAKVSCPDGVCDQNETNTLDGWLDQKITGGDIAQDIQNQLHELADKGNDNDALRRGLDGVAPDVSPLVQAHATEITRRLAAITSERFYNSMERTGYVHNGKRFYRFPRHDSNLWVQGLYGKSKYDVRKGWDMDTKGVAVGFDGHVSEAFRMGISYAYTKADGKSVQRDTDIESHTGMIYGEYNPNRFYANWLAMYTRSQYDEDKKVFQHRIKADYDVDAVGAQVMLGRKMGPYVSGNWASGVIKPELGMRYIYTKQHGYTDSIGQQVGSADGHTLTGILGAQYTIGYTLSPSLSWYPELRAALTYDFVEPDTKMRVNLMNGSTYEVKTENMDRFGIEVGAKVGLDINRKAEIALEYEGLFKGDYTNHMGLANLKYKF